MTTGQAHEREFKVVFGSDVASTDDPQLQDPKLRVLRRGFAKVLAFDAIISALRLFGLVIRDGTGDSDPTSYIQTGEE
jgi:hypothetical protein